MAKYRYTVQFLPAPEGGFVVRVPALPGLTTEGDSLSEARQMAEEAIVGYLESLREHGEEIPVEDAASVTEHVTVNLSAA